MNHVSLKKLEIRYNHPNVVSFPLIPILNTNKTNNKENHYTALISTICSLMKYDKCTLLRQQNRRNLSNILSFPLILLSSIKPIKLKEHPPC